MGPGITQNFLENSPVAVLIFWGIIPCVFCVYMLLKFGSHYDLSVLSMSVAGFQKKVCIEGVGGSALSSVFCDFYNLYDFAKHLTLTALYCNFS